MPDALALSGNPRRLFPEILAEHEARWDAEIAADAARARRRNLNEAIADLTRAADSARLGCARDQSISCAAAALRRAGLHEQAARAEDDDADGGRLIAELVRIEGRLE